MHRSVSDPVTVLYVDDESEAADATATAIERENDRVTVETAASVGDAEERLADGSVDCVVSEYDLPDEDGIAFLRKVRSEYRDLPFVLYTGSGSESVAADAVSAGATDYLQNVSGTDQHAVLASRVVDAVERYRSAYEWERRGRRAHELEVTRRRFDAVYNNPFAFMGILEPDGTVVSINETALAFIDPPLEAIAGEAFWRTPWWDHSEELRDDLRSWIDRAAAGDVVRYEADHVAPDGERVTVDGVLHPIRDGDGTIVSLLAAERDISERREHEEAIDALHVATRELIAADSEAEIATLVAETASDLFDLPHTGVHLHSEEADALVPEGWTETVTETIGEPPVLRRESLAWEAFNAGETRVYDLSANEGHNPETPLQSELIAPLGRYGVAIVASEERDAFDRDDRRLIKLLCGNAAAALERVTRERLLREHERELERTNDRLKEFANTVSHDLRNPLNVAQGRLELIESDCESDHVRAIERSHERMEALIDDLLTLARNGETPVETAPLELADLVESCWRNVDTKTATLVTEADATIHADENRVRRLFENLIGNAVEHGSTSSRPQADDAVEHGSTSPASQAPEDGESVTVTVGTLEDGFYVEDDGPGIPEDEREEVFESGYSTATDGTGFGLNIVEQVAEVHDWDVRVTAGADGGARFEITGVDIE